MIKKSVFVFAIAALLATASCKEESAASKIDPSTEAVAPASPDAVIAPDPNIAAAPAEKPTVTVAPPADGKYPKMTFAKEEHDFGTIKETETVTHSFKFTNTGEADLIITSAKGSCGCTVPDYPKDPIKPGATGNIKVSFNPSGKKGQQHKTVTILTNTASGQEKLGVKATILDAGATK